ncbi:glutaredoxin family protein [Salinicoccus sp. ID82-1]|uniref:Glutaredoxin family protein n=1 Tax=Salinicoccus cyprini TaxID=2493691 RepID=A0A558AUZ6_9STAP|nr:MULTISPECIES: glutaredoxin family protein [Salinicoccus]MCG1010558.1 glutaredoxin family protein [Salinicoccus sp. ID82-1]TVT28075.1 glutaredoxin family protein [Salinicoccus cyprini]
MTNYQLEVYSRPTCSDCQNLKQFLRAHSISYTEYDLSEQPEKEQDLKKITGSRIVPALVFSRPAFMGIKRKRTSMIGFEQNEEKIRTLLNIT